MKRALLFARDPGGANVIIPLVRPLRNAAWDVRLFGKDSAMGRFQDVGLVGNAITERLPEVSSDSVDGFLREESPDIVVTATSADDFTEKQLWSSAENQRIPTLAVLDQWINYGVRFSRFDVSTIAHYEKERSLTCLPARIATIDEFARQEMITEGIPVERIVVCGQPAFEGIFNSRRDPAAVESFCRTHEITDSEYVVAFASEPLTKTYGDPLSYWGYTERSILALLVKELGRLASGFSRKIVLVVRLHPKEPDWDAVPEIARHPDIRTVVDRRSQPRTIMERADLVCGMSSMFLVESILVGKAVLSIQIGLRRENPFMFDRRGILKSILSEPELSDQLRKVIVEGEWAVCPFEVIRNPVERVIAEMESMTCRS